MAYWKQVNMKIEETLITLGDGENTFGSPFDIKDSESMESINLSGSKYPALTTRDPRSLYGATPLTTANAIGERNNTNLHVVDGAVWKYWNGSAYVNVQTGLTSATATFKDFATGTTRYTIMMNGTDKYAWDGTTVTNLTNAPASKLFTTHKGHVFIARDNDIVFSALNLINDYTAVADAGTIDITNAKGVITAIHDYDGHVFAWTEFSTHVLLGTGYSDFNLQDIEGGVGCISDRAVAVCNKRLYWVAYDGVYMTEGLSGAVKVSSKVDSYFEDMTIADRATICCGAIGDYLYVSIPLTNSLDEARTLLKYDTKLGNWYPEDGEFLDFVTIGNVLVGVDSDGVIHNMVEGTVNPTIYWDFKSKPFYKQTLSRNKTLSEIWVLYDLDNDKTLTIKVSTSFDDDDWTEVESIQADSVTDTESAIKRTQIPLTLLQGCDWFRIRLTGTGTTTIHALELKYRIRG